ncbi:unnamed protein product [Heterobilharzia americana]|nr:unnamed protein product [Heterobilharzia americana]
MFAQPFVLPNGSQLCFYIKPCGYLPCLKTAIVENGGIVSESIGENCIYLATPGMVVDTGEYIHCNYIWDCIRSKSRLPMRNYYVEPGVTVTETLPTDNDSQFLTRSSYSVLSTRSRKPFTKNESLTLWKYIQDNKLLPLLNKRSTYKHLEAARVTNHCAESIRTHIRQILLPAMGRSNNHDRNKRYNLKEDEAIINYLVEKNLWKRIRSRALWRKMAKERVTSHSSESMRNRFRHYLMNATYARLMNKLTKSEREEMSDVFFGHSKRNSNPMDCTDLNNVDIYHVSYSIDECSLTSSQTNSVVTEVAHSNRLSEPHSNETTNIQIPPFHETVQCKKNGVSLQNCAIELSSLSSLPGITSTSSSPGSPQRLCNSCPIPPAVIRANKLAKLKSNELGITSSSSLSFKSPSLPVPSITSYLSCQDTSHSSFMTSDSSVPLPSTSYSYPLWISQLMNSPYITTQLQAILLVSMTNGSVREAHNFLTTGTRQPSSVNESSLPPWLPEDDESLSSTDTELLDKLVDRFGWTEITQRFSFLYSQE